MAKSIIQQTKVKECLLCRMEAEDAGYYGELPCTGLHKHHFIHGSANRKKAEHYGLWAYVCAERHHEYGPGAPHANAEVDRRLKQMAQRIFEEKYGHELWMQEFAKNYLEKEDTAEPEEGGRIAPPGIIFIEDPVEGDIWPG